MESNQNQLKSEEERKAEFLEKKKWSVFFQSGFFVAIAGYLSSFGWKLYALNGEKQILILIAILYIGAWLLAYWMYKDYKKVSGKSW
jgi:hypothetical protein